jgi:hypothetical protein
VKHREQRPGPGWPLGQLRLHPRPAGQPRPGLPFNKMRMCVFPKHYVFNANEPPRHPFEPLPGCGWDFSRFNPGCFRHLE